MERKRWAEKMETYALIEEVNGVDCAVEALSVREDHKLRYTRTMLVCNNKGEIKESAKVLEQAEYDDKFTQMKKLVPFEKGDKYITCEKYTVKHMGKIQEENMYIQVYDYAYRCVVRGEEVVELKKDQYKAIENYESFDFSSLLNYTEFGVYSNAVMTAAKRAVSA